jgi:hypothetical protein
LTIVLYLLLLLMLFVSSWTSITIFIKHLFLDTMTDYIFLFAFQQIHRLHSIYNLPIITMALMLKPMIQNVPNACNVWKRDEEEKKKKDYRVIKCLYISQTDFSSSIRNLYDNMLSP